MHLRNVLLEEERETIYLLAFISFWPKVVPWVLTHLLFQSAHVWEMRCSYRYPRPWCEMFLQGGKQETPKAESRWGGVWLYRSKAGLSLVKLVAAIAGANGETKRIQEVYKQILILYFTAVLNIWASPTIYLEGKQSNGSLWMRLSGGLKNSHSVMGKARNVSKIRRCCIQSDAGYTT